MSTLIRRVKAVESGRTGVIIRSNGMCYDVKMDDNGETLSGGKKRWKAIHPPKMPKAVNK